MAVLVKVLHMGQYFNISPLYLENILKSLSSLKSEERPFNVKHLYISYSLVQTLMVIYACLLPGQQVP